MYKDEKIKRARAKRKSASLCSYRYGIDCTFLWKGFSSARPHFLSDLKANVCQVQSGLQDIRVSTWNLLQLRETIK